MRSLNISGLLNYAMTGSCLSAPVYPRHSVFFLLITILVVSACANEQLVFPPVTHAQTRGYCGSCHMAFQPSMLPAASWQRMMNELDDHFKEKVKLPLAAKQQVGNYLITNAGDTEAAGRPGRIALRGLAPNASLQRITNTPYFKEEHRFLKNRILDEWVDSVSNCTACHVGAWVGDYRE